MLLTFGPELDSPAFARGLGQPPSGAPEDPLGSEVDGGFFLWLLRPLPALDSPLDRKLGWGGGLSFGDAKPKNGRATVEGLKATDE